MCYLKKMIFVFIIILISSQQSYGRQANGGFFGSLFSPKSSKKQRARSKGYLRGWVYGKFVEDGRIISDTGLKLRARGNLTGEVLMVIPYDTEVEVLQTRGDWKFVKVSSASVARKKRSRRGKSKLVFNYGVFYRLSGGNIDGNADNQDLLKLSMKSFIGGGVLITAHNIGRRQFRYSLGFDYYQNAKIDNLKMPAGYNASLGVSYANLYKRLSPFLTISYESHAAPGQVIDPTTGQWKDIAFSINTPDFDTIHSIKSLIGA